MNLRASFIELFSRVIKVDKSKDGDVYWNGENNLYPNEIELVVNNSPTASRASKIMAKYISGSGLADDAQNVIVNFVKNYKLSNVISIIGKDIAKQGGSFIHIGYGISEDGNLRPVSLDVLPYVNCRKQKEDDSNNLRKIFYRDFSEKSIFGAKKQKQKWFYSFDNDIEVVVAQIKADYFLKTKKESEDIAEMLPHYRGQIYYLNTTPEYKYTLAPIDSVFNDADSEYRISNYINTSWREGLLGKTMVLVQGLDDEQSRKVQDDISHWLGSENSSGLFYMDFEQADDLSKVIRIEQIKAQFDEKIFSETAKSLRSNILGAYNSIPEILVIPQAGIMGQSGEAYVQAKAFYNEQTSDERRRVSETLTYLGFPCEIKPIEDGIITTI